jgi:hypothetical protein
MTKRRTKAQKIGDCFDAFKCIKEGRKVKRSGAKDGSIATHPVVPVPELSERDVLAECKKWLDAHHIPCDRNNVGAGQMGTSGFHSYGIKNGGDIIGWLPRSGIHFEIECKKGKGGRLSKGQQERQIKCEETCALYFVIHGVPELEYYFGDLI